MATALRLSGNRDLAAQYWGEAKRLLFQLQMRVQTAGIDSGAITRTYPDGSIITVQSIFGANTIDILSPFPPPAALPRSQKTFYILCYRSDTLKKFYSLIMWGNSIEVLEADISLALNIIQLSSATAMTILEDTEPTAYVIEYGLTFSAWLRHETSVSTSGQAKGYDDRYLYRNRGESGIHQFLSPRFIESFLSQTGRSYKTSYYYYPKLTAPETIEWTKALHADYGISADIKGKNNITLNEAKTFATSWGERIHDSAAASYSFYSNYMMGNVTDPWNGEPDNILLESFMWPIVTTFNPIKKPRVYTFQYQADDGSHENSLFTETLNWSDNFTYPNWPYLTAYTRSLSGTMVNYWLMAAMGDLKALYIKNSFTVGGSEILTTTVLRSGPYGDDIEKEGSGSRNEQLTQEFYAGDVLLDSAISTAALSWTSYYSAIWNDAVPTLNETTENTRTLTGNFYWFEVLDYFNHQGDILVFYKKIHETLSISRTENSTATSNPPSSSFSNAQNATAVRTVEYYMAWKFGESSGKELLATFTANQTSGYTDSGTPSYTFNLSGSGERIYGISCQLTESLGVFSFNKETFNGVGGADYFKSPAYQNDGIADLYLYYFNYQPTTSPPFVYPFPLEDGNNLIDTSTYAWTGNFCVGAIAIAIPETDIGTFGFGEFNNQTDIVAATGIVAKEE